MMIKKILKKDLKDNLKLFSDIKIQKEYSNLSKELSIQYHNFTYSSFYHNLKNCEERAKKGNTFTLLSVSPYPDKNRYIKPKFDIEKMKLAIEKMKEEEKSMMNKKEHPYSERNRDSLSFSIYGLLKSKNKIIEEIKQKREKEKKSISPGLGRYNPKYKSIEKHTQRAIFSFQNFKKFNKAFNQKLMIQKRKIKEEDKELETKIENMKKKLKAFNFKFRKKEKQKLKEQKAKKEKREKLILKTENNENNTNEIPHLFHNTAVYKNYRNRDEDIYKIKTSTNNHCFKFETYTDRKPLLIKTAYLGNSPFRLSSSAKNIKKNIHHKKIYRSLSKNYFEKLIEEKKYIPSIGFYRPNYSLVTCKTMDIYFNGKKDQKNNRKYFKLKKILGNYKVRGDYELFHFLNYKDNKNKK